ncbi:891_t:CDS:2, partial [Gigaspora margarita]
MESLLGAAALDKQQLLKHINKKANEVVDREINEMVDIDKEVDEVVDVDKEWIEVDKIVNVDKEIDEIVNKRVNEVVDEIVNNRLCEVADEEINEIANKEIDGMIDKIADKMASEIITDKVLTKNKIFDRSLSGDKNHPIKRYKPSTLATNTNINIQ